MVALGADRTGSICRAISVRPWRSAGLWGGPPALLKLNPLLCFVVMLFYINQTVKPSTQLDVVWECTAQPPVSLFLACLLCRYSNSDANQVCLCENRWTTLCKSWLLTDWYLLTPLRTEHRAFQSVTPLSHSSHVTAYHLVQSTVLTAGNVPSSPRAMHSRICYCHNVARLLSQLTCI